MMKYIQQTQKECKISIWSWLCFTALFYRGNHGWVLLGETGVTSGYIGSVGSHLSDFSPETGYILNIQCKEKIIDKGVLLQVFWFQVVTPWRTITVCSSLSPIVLTMVPYVLVNPLYRPSTIYNPGRYI